MRVYTPFEWHRQCELLAEQTRLEGLHGGLRSAATSRSDYEPHDVTDDEAAAQADAAEVRLAAICNALERIESGGYGQCQECGSPIARERLEALPMTTVCRECTGRDTVVPAAGLGLTPRAAVGRWPSGESLQGS